MPFRTLSENDLANELERLPDWRVSEGQLKASFSFADFRTAFAFITMVALEAEARGHHPAWSNVYNKVEFALSTHDAGGTITELDLVLAGAISKVAETFRAG